MFLYGSILKRGGKQGFFWTKLERNDVNRKNITAKVLDAPSSFNFEDKEDSWGILPKEDVPIKIATSRSKDTAGSHGVILKQAAPIITTMLSSTSIPRGALSRF
jgi:hypothetical protein